MKTIFNTIITIITVIITIVLTVLLHEEAGTTDPVDAWLSSAAIATIIMMTIIMCVGIIFIDINVYDKLENLLRKFKRNTGYHNMSYGSSDYIVRLSNGSYYEYEYTMSKTWYAYERYLEYLDYKEALHSYIGSQRAIIKSLYPAKGTMADMLLHSLYGMIKVFGHLTSEWSDGYNREIPIFKMKYSTKEDSIIEPKVGEIITFHNTDYMVIMLSYDAEMNDNILWLQDMKKVPQELLEY